MSSRIGDFVYDKFTAKTQRAQRFHNMVLLCVLCVSAVNSKARLHLSTAFEGAAEGDLVGVLQVAAHGQAAGDAGGAHTQPGQLPVDEHGGRVPLGGGVGRQDDLFDRVLLGALDQF